MGQQLLRAALDRWLPAKAARQKRLHAAALVLATVTAVAQAPSALAQEVFFGVADQWPALLAQKDAWPYVQAHADGFYVNFVMMNRLIRHSAGMGEATLQQTCALFASHAAYLESDIRTPPPGRMGGGSGDRDEGASAEQDATYVRMLHQAGCKVPYTSLNYGWSVERAQNLTTYELAEARRLNFVQTGPWALNGDVEGPSAPEHPGYNERLRQWIGQSDGVATDGPLGYWAADYKHFRDADVSLVQFAHRLHKRVMIMLAPYAANQAQAYQPKRDLLATGQAMVRTMEDRQAIPDIWAVFEYATDIAPTPEQEDGKPANSMAGLAFWLIHHVHDPAHWAQLELNRPEAGGAHAVDLTLGNRSTWLDIAPLLHLRLHCEARDVRVRLTLDGRDVTRQATSSQGLALTGILELQPGTRRALSLTVTQAGTVMQAGLEVAANAALADSIGDLAPASWAELTLAPNPGVPNEIHQRVVIPLSPTANAAGPAKATVAEARVKRRPAADAVGEAGLGGAGPMRSATPAASPGRSRRQARRPVVISSRSQAASPSLPRHSA